MSNLIEKTKSAYAYPLLIKQLFEAPLANHPEQEIVYRDQLTLTYSNWKERVHRLAGALAAIGVTEGSTVAVMDWNSHRYLEAYYAIPMMGAVLYTINIRLSPEQMMYTIYHSEDDVIICHTEFLPLLESIRGRISEGRKFILIDEGGEISKHHFQFEGEYEQMLADAPPVYDFPELDENTRATTFYTTGTTSLPKGVYFSHRQLVLHKKSGSIRITDRTKDVIKVGEECLSSLEMEDVIARHTGVSEVAVIGAPDTNWGEIPLAIIVPKAGAIFKDREIVQAVKASVDLGVLPREAITMRVVRAKVIDKTSVGKVNKVVLRAKFLRD